MNAVRRNVPGSCKLLDLGGEVVDLLLNWRDEAFQAVRDINGVRRRVPFRTDALRDDKAAQKCRQLLDTGHPTHTQKYFLRVSRCQMRVRLSILRPSLPLQESAFPGSSRHHRDRA